MWKNVAFDLFWLFIYCRQKEDSHFKRKHNLGGETNDEINEKEGKSA